MAVGQGIITQSRLRPLRSAAILGTVVAGNLAGLGAGINYGMGTGATRISGITYSFRDLSLLYDMRSQTFLARICVVNSDYPFNAQTFAPYADLSAMDILFDVDVHDAGPTFLPLWQSGIVTDEGEKATLLVSQLYFPAGPPPNILPQATINLHGDHYRSRADALSPGSIFGDPH